MSFSKISQSCQSMRWLNENVDVSLLNFANFIMEIIIVKNVLNNVNDLSLVIFCSCICKKYKRL